MKKLALSICVLALVASCNTTPKTELAGGGDSSSTSQPANLPYKASYSGIFNNNVSDADLNMVLKTYKDWSGGNMKALEAAMGDTVEYDMNTGKHLKLARPALMKMWTTSRDSLKSVTIEMEAWNKMYSIDKRDSFIVTWYKETDTYQTGKIDSAHYHDINQVKNGKIVWYSQYKRPAKP